MSEARPLECRFRCQDEGRAYPRSSCRACGKTITTGLGVRCSFKPEPDAAARQRERIAMRDDLAGFFEGYFGCKSTAAVNLADRLMNEGWIKGGEK